jgi:hypothetical protein
MKVQSDAVRSTVGPATVQFLILEVNMNMDNPVLIAISFPTTPFRGIQNYVNTVA